VTDLDKRSSLLEQGINNWSDFFGQSHSEQTYVKIQKIVKTLDDSTKVDENYFKMTLLLPLTTSA